MSQLMGMSTRRNSWSALCIWGKSVAAAGTSGGLSPLKGNLAKAAVGFPPGDSQLSEMRLHVLDLLEPPVTGGAACARQSQRVGFIQV